MRDGGRKIGAVGERGCGLAKAGEAICRVGEVRKGRRAHLDGGRGELRRGRSKWQKPRGEGNDGPGVGLKRWLAKNEKKAIQLTRAMGLSEVEVSGRSRLLRAARYTRRTSRLDSGEGGLN